MSQTCPYCRLPIEGQESAACPACGTIHHRGCWEENGGCTIFGCSQAPVEEAKMTVHSNEARPSPAASQGYYLGRGQERFGPYSLDQLREFQSQGRADGADLVWTQGMANWTALREVLGLSARMPIVPQRPPVPPPPPQATVAHPHYAQERPYQHPLPKPSSHLAGAILATLFCCPVFGIVAIVYAAQVDSKYAAGDYQGAAAASQAASKWLWASAATGIIVGILYFFAGAAGANL